MSTTYLNGAKVWELHATRGLPLEVSLMWLAKRGIMVTWQDLLTAASQDGADWETLIPRLSFAVREAYSGELAGPICERLKNIQESVTS